MREVTSLTKEAEMLDKLSTPDVTNCDGSTSNGVRPEHKEQGVDGVLTSADTTFNECDVERDTSGEDDVFRPNDSQDAATNSL